MNVIAESKTKVN